MGLGAYDPRITLYQPPFYGSAQKKILLTNQWPGDNRRPSGTMPSGPDRKAFVRLCDARGGGRIGATRYEGGGFAGALAAFLETGLLRAAGLYRPLKAP